MKRATRRCGPLIILFVALGAASEEHVIKGTGEPVGGAVAGQAIEELGAPERQSTTQAYLAHLSSQLRVLCDNPDVLAKYVNDRPRCLRAANRFFRVCLARHGDSMPTDLNSVEHQVWALQLGKCVGDEMEKARLESPTDRATPPRQKVR